MVYVINEDADVLQEMHFSNEDLQNPDTLNKIVRSKEQFESVLKYIGYLFVALDIAAGVALTAVMKSNKIPHAFKAGIAASIVLGTILSKLKEALDALPAKQYKKNYAKFLKKIDQLIEKMERCKEKDPKNAKKYQKVIDNCKAVLAKIEQDKKDADARNFEMAVESYIDNYKDLVRYYNKPWVLGHTGERTNRSLYRIDVEFMGLLQAYGVKENKIVENCTQKMKVRDDYQWMFGYDEDGEELAKKFEGKKYVHISSDDEYNVFATVGDNKMYSTDGYRVESTSFYKEMDGTMSTTGDKALIEFDKRMGFYKFSKCPENVKKKPFGIFQ